MKTEIIDKVLSLSYNIKLLTSILEELKFKPNPNFYLKLDWCKDTSNDWKSVFLESEYSKILDPIMDKYSKLIKEDLLNLLEKKKEELKNL